MITIRAPASSKASDAPSAPIMEMDELPLPDYSGFVEEWERLGLQRAVPLRLPMEFSRGCWWGQRQHCVFCGLNGNTMTFRAKTPARVFYEIDRVLEAYRDRVEHLSVVDNILAMSYFDDVLPGLRERELGPSLFFETKSNLTEAQVRQLADARVVAIQPGIESLSTPVLKLMRKGCTALTNIQLLKWCARYGIQPGWNLLFGFPDEEPDDYQVLADRIPLLSHLHPPAGAGPIRLDRYSPLHRNPESSGIVNMRPHWTYPLLHPHVDDSLMDLAYFFEFDYQDGRDLAYARPVQDAVEHWRSLSSRSSLIAFTAAPEWMIWDTRGIATAEWVHLDEVYSAVLRAVGHIRRPDSVAKELALDEQRVLAVLARLAELHLVVEDDGRWLGLPVETDVAAPARLPPAVPRLEVRTWVH